MRWKSYWFCVVLLVAGASRAAAQTSTTSVTSAVTTNEIRFEMFDTSLGLLQDAEATAELQSGNTSANGAHTHSLQGPPPPTSRTSSPAGTHTHSFAIPAVSGGGLSVEAFGWGTNPAGNHTHGVLSNGTVATAGTHTHFYGSTSRPVTGETPSLFVGSNPITIATPNVTTSEGGTHVHSVSGAPPLAPEGLHSHTVTPRWRTSTTFAYYGPTSTIDDTLSMVNSGSVAGVTLTSGDSLSTNGHDLNVANAVILGQWNFSGSDFGGFVHQGGTVRAAEVYIGSESPGEYELFSGLLEATSISIGSSLFFSSNGVLDQIGGDILAESIHLGFGGGTGTYLFQGGSVTTNDLIIESTGSFDFTGGTLNADLVTGDLTQDGGLITIGNSPGAMDIDGDYTLNAGSLEIELGGYLAGTEFDFLDITGEANLAGGSLDVLFWDGFAANKGDLFTFLAADGGVAGTFDWGSSTLPDLGYLGPEFGWELQYGTDRVTLAVVPEVSAVTLCGIVVVAVVLVSVLRRVALQPTF